MGRRMMPRVPFDGGRFYQLLYKKNLSLSAFVSNPNFEWGYATVYNAAARGSISEAVLESICRDLGVEISYLSYYKPGDKRSKDIWSDWGNIEGGSHAK